MGKKAIGIDIGGTGIKAGVVDLGTGNLVGERLRRDTPDGGKPADISKLVAQIVRDLPDAKPKMLIGICFPAITKNGVTLSAANVSQEWIGLDADDLFTKALNRPVHVLNDADAAGVAEMKYGAGKNKSGLVIMTTLGTGIGTALFLNGKLIPNAELGHLEIDGVDYETQASYGAKERDNLDWPGWTARLQKYFSTLEKLFSPDLIIVGGGVSKHHQEFLPLLKIKTPIVAAEKRNNAGILGAAAMASKHLR
jgi:polyphosphate glucokinase